MKRTEIFSAIFGIYYLNLNLFVLSDFQVKYLYRPIKDWLKSNDFRVNDPSLFISLSIPKELILVYLKAPT